MAADPASTSSAKGIRPAEVAAHLRVIATPGFHDYALLEAGFGEAIRVLRPRGVLQLSPVFYRARQPAERACEVNQRRLIAGLKSNRRFQVSDRILGFNAGIGEIVGRLTVTKLT